MVERAGWRTCGQGEWKVPGDWLVTPAPDFAGSLRRHLYRQAERVAAFVHARSATWTGLSWR